MISIKKVESRSDWRSFLRFPWTVYRDSPAWIPPILREQKRQLLPETGAFFNDGAESASEYFLARRQGEVVGRIAAIANEIHRRTHRDGVGFFGFFESIDDQRVAHELLTEAEAWLAARNFHISRGPASFTIYDPVGVTIFGGDVRPGMGMAHTPPYYATLLEACGYRKVRDLLAYRFTYDGANSSHFNSMMSAIGADGGEIEIRPLKCLDPSDAEVIAKIFNLAWEANWGTIPMTAEDFLRIQKEMGPFADERLVYLASKDGEPVAFFVSSLDPGEMIQRMNGRMTPGGLYSLMFKRHRIKEARVILMGVLPDYRNGPAVGQLLLEFFRHWKEFPAVESLEVSWILEDNVRIRKLVENLGARHSHTFRVFEKFL